MQHELSGLIAYFGIDAKKNNPTEIFDIIKRFRKELENAVDGLAKKALNTSSHPIINRSSSTPNFLRSSRNSSLRGSRNSSLRGSRNSSSRSSRNSSFRKSVRSMSINSNYSDVSNRERDVSSIAGSAIVFDCKDEDSLEDLSASSLAANESQEVDTRDNKHRGFVTPQNEASQDSSYSTMSSVSSLKMTPQGDNDSASEADSPLYLKRRKMRPKTPFTRKNIDDVLSMMSAEEDTAKEELRKVLLSPVREKADKNKITDKKEEASAEVVKRVDKLEDRGSSKEERCEDMKPVLRKEEDLEVPQPRRRLPDSFVNGKRESYLAYAKSEEKAMTLKKNSSSDELLDRISKLKETNREKNSVVSTGNADQLKGPYELLKKDNGAGSTSRIANGLQRDSSLKHDEYSSSEIDYKMKLDLALAAARRDRETLDLKIAKPSSLHRNSSLRRSNRKVTRVSIKAMQVRELQKTKKLLISRSACSRT